MRVLGIDPGLNIMGYAIVSICRGKPPQLELYGIFRTSPRDQLDIRCWRIFEQIDLLLQTHNVDLLSIENQFIGKNADTSHKLIMAKTSAILPASKRKIPVVQYNPCEIKKCFSRGDLSKEKVKNKVQKILRQEINSTLDASDAAAIALVGILRYKF